MDETLGKFSLLLMPDVLFIVFLYTFFCVDTIYVFLLL